MTHAEVFRIAALAEVEARIEQLRSTLTYDGALSLPEAESSDIVIAAREVQLTIFRQANVPFLEGQVLVTVQIARHGLGGVVSFRIERGLVLAQGAPPRAAAEQELTNSRS